MQIPSRADWGEIDENDLDAKWAFDTFFGKSFAAAEEMFQSNAMHFGEDLESMPAAPLNFYAPALVQYITSEHAKGDADGASTFLHRVAWLLKSRGALLHPETEVALIGAADQVARRQNFYEADEDIYGRFADLYVEIQRLAGRGA